ncbi:hypothetical protein Hypma_014457 [Hypsizygus marmoreus]|uniref:Uncharacterized protein n=1 Tax=Hypsizygus marmoreus TaxID=39966 RepID=A0A369JFA0_HYPMA|nr:hypothetical protein Hypma_014457 [Hypsizygus marmoreus]
MHCEEKRSPLLSMWGAARVISGGSSVRTGSKLDFVFQSRPLDEREHCCNSLNPTTSASRNSGLYGTRSSYENQWPLQQFILDTPHDIAPDRLRVFSQLTLIVIGSLSIPRLQDSPLDMLRISSLSLSIGHWTQLYMLRVRVGGHAPPLNHHRYHSPLHFNRCWSSKRRSLTSTLFVDHPKRGRWKYLTSSVVSYPLSPGKPSSATFERYRLSEYSDMPLSRIRDGRSLSDVKSIPSSHRRWAHVSEHPLFLIRRLASLSYSRCPRYPHSIVRPSCSAENATLHAHLTLSTVIFLALEASLSMDNISSPIIPSAPCSSMLDYSIHHARFRVSYVPDLRIEICTSMYSATWLSLARRETAPLIGADRPSTTTLLRYVFEVLVSRIVLWRSSV